MDNIEKIHQAKTPKRTHYIVEWAERRNMRQTDIASEIDADKSLISRWFKGTIPSPEWQEKLAALFEIDVAGLFRHPDDDWLSKFFKDRTDEQKEKAIQMLKLMFDNNKRETGTDG